jgi:3-phenylpropionate/cinnamic acid dioxygenase small subunit
MTTWCYIPEDRTILERNVYRILVGKPEGKKPLGRTIRRWVDNIKIDQREIEWDDMGRMNLAQDRNQWRALMNMVMNLWVP